MTEPGPAAVLRSLHQPGQPVILPNVWDSMSARVFAGAGFPALATSSSAVAESLGYADGERTPQEEAFAAIARITRTAGVPVSADVEAGYRLAAAELAAHLAGAGAAGCNLEDSDPRTHELGGPAAFAGRIAALREAAGDALVINARIDVFLPGRFAAGPAAAVAAAIGRGRRYLAAGADCVYPILAPPPVVPDLVTGIGGPVNILFLPHGPSIPELAALGVSRITFGGGLLHRAVAELTRLAQGIQRQAGSGE